MKPGTIVKCIEHNHWVLKFNKEYIVTRSYIRDYDQMEMLCLKWNNKLGERVFLKKRFKAVASKRNLPSWW